LTGHMMDCQSIKNKYYSKRLGKDNILNEIPQDIHFIYSDERNKIQIGYPMLWIPYAVAYFSTLLSAPV